MAKYIDVGLSCIMPQCNHAGGSPYQMSPEIIRAYHESEGNVTLEIARFLRQSFGKETDVWALGATFYSLLTQVPVFGTAFTVSKSFSELTENVRIMIMTDTNNGIKFNKHFQENFPRLTRFIEPMLIYDPTKRVSVGELLEFIDTLTDGIGTGEGGVFF